MTVRMTAAEQQSVREYESKRFPDGTHPYEESNMASNVKLKDIGVLYIEPQLLQREHVVHYEDPQLRTPQTFGYGKSFRNEREAITALAQDLRRRGYTGTMKVRRTGTKGGRG